jgi:hypothetical protein
MEVRMNKLREWKREELEREYALQWDKYPFVRSVPKDEYIEQSIKAYQYMSAGGVMYG